MTKIILPDLNVEKTRIIYKWNDSRTSVYEISLNAWKYLGTVSSLDGYESQVFLSEDVFENIGVIRGPKVGKIKNPYFQKYCRKDEAQSEVIKFI